MKRSDLTAAVAAYKETTREALQLIWDNTNKGQRNKLLKNEDIKNLLIRYQVIYEEDN